MRIDLVTDGSAAPTNPGPMACGYIAHDVEAGTLYLAGRETLGHGTNNRAEYLAVINGLRALLAANLDLAGVNVWCDSALLVNQLNGTFRVKDSSLKKLYLQVGALCREIGVPVSFRWHRREADWAPVADLLSKEDDTAKAITMWKGVWETRDKDKVLKVAICED